MAALFWVGGSTAYDGVTNRLATTSGGAASVAVITSADTVTFDANSPAAAAVTTSAAISCSALTINGLTGSLTMSNTLTVTGALTHTTGTLNTNGQTCTLGSYTQGAGTKTLTLGSSAISCNSWLARTASITVTANTAVVTQSGAASTFDNNSLAGVNYNGMSLVQSGSGAASVGLTTGVTSTITLANYTRTGTAVKTDSLTIGAPLTVTGTATFNGNSITNRIIINSSVYGTARTITAAVTSISNADFQDITAAGAAAWTGTSVGNALGNSGITFTTPVTRYAVVAGNWSSTATWSSTSGGAGGSSVPLAHDTVILDANSAAGTYTVDMPRIGADQIHTGFTRTLSWTTNINPTMYGSFTMSSGATYSYGNTVNWTFAGRGTHTITTAGNTLTGTNFAPTIAAFGGSYTNQDALTSGHTWSLTDGTWNTNGFTITIAIMLVSGTRNKTLTLGASTINLTATTGTPWNITATGLTLNSNTSNIVISTASASTRTFAGGSMTYNMLTYTVAGSTGQLNITGSNTMGIAFSDITNARTLAFTAGTTTTITTWNVNGTAGKLMSVNSITAATHTLTKASGTISSDYLSLTNSIATGGAAWYAGANSTNVSGNTGWIFSAAPTGSTGNFFLMFGAV